MGKKSGPSPPPAPDPVKTAQAQSQANAETARLEQKLNAVNSYSPYGSVTYDQFAPDRWSQTTTLSPNEQAIYDRQSQAERGALDVANQQIGRVGDALNQGFDTSSLPALQGNVQSGQLQTSVNPYGFQSGFDPGQGVQGSFDIGGQLQQGFNPGGQIQSGISQGQPVQGQVDQGGLLAYGFNPGQGVQGQVGPTDFSADRQAVTDAYWNEARSRLDPMWQQQQDRLDTRLANQGLGVNSTAYDTTQGQFGRNRNDAYNTALYGAIQQGAEEQNRLFGQSLAQGQFANNAAAQEYAQNQGLAAFQNNAAGQQFAQNLGAGQFANQAAAQQYAQNLGQGQFANQAQQQQYGQNQGLAQFANQAALDDYMRNSGLAQFQNQAAAQQYGQNMGQADFYNQAQQSQFGQDLAAGQFTNQAQGQQFSQDAQAAQLANQARNQGFQEQAYQQNLPVNLFNSLMSSSQVQAPQGVQYSPVGVAPTDVLGAYALNANVAQQNYQTQSANRNALLGGLSQLGGAAMMAFSDIRLKRDIHRIGERGGLGVYLFRYLWSPVQYIGVMAQEVLGKKPEAVSEIGGYLAVDYGRL